MDLATAYVQIVPSAKGIKGSITKELGGECTSAGTSSGESFGSAMVGKIKGVIAAAGLGTVLKATIDAGAAIQQSFGGLDTIYGEASDAAKKYAKDAAQVGISANEYAEQAVSFGASLKMAFGGDTTKAVEAANTAIMDMTDNAAKMGTPLESIQTAYQGFAKQNYTMLDNLKLGYGGTKQEMERLLADAQKITGVKYDLNNLGDVYDAIHVIQGELGLTGVAADEAATTFSGSFGAMKASLTNVMAAIATGENIYEPLQTLFGNIKNFLINNLAPMLANVLEALPQLLTNLISEIGLMLSDLAKNANDIVDFGVQLVMNIVDGMTQSSGDLLKGIWDICKALFEALVNYDWAGAASKLVQCLSSSLSESAFSMFGNYDANIIDSLLSGINKNLPKLLKQGTEFINQIVTGITDMLPTLISTAGDLIVEFCDCILTNLPSILASGVSMIMNLVQGIVDNLPEIVSAAVEVTGQFLESLTDHLPEILEMGITLLGEIVSGIISALPQIVEAVFTLHETLWDVWSDIDWLELGKNLIEGVAEGVSNFAGALWDAIKNACAGALDAAKDFFGISSPSKVMRDQVGKWLPEGMAIGIEDNSKVVNDAMSELTDEAMGSINGDIRSVVSVQSNNAKTLNRSSVNGTVATDTNGINAIIEALSRVTVEMDGRAVGNLVATPVNNALGRINVRRT